MKKNIKTRNNGFTILEMIVALGVFATVAVLSISSLLSLTNAQKKARTLQSIQDNLRFSMEAIARDLRQGDFFYCGSNLEDFPTAPSPGDLPVTKDCAGGQMVTFVDRNNKVSTYRLGDPSFSYFTTTTSCAVGHLCIEKAVRDTYAQMPPIFYPVTSRDIEITRFDLYVSGSNRTDQIEPRVTIVVDGVAKVGKEESEFHLQTTVSSHRNLTRD